MDRADDRDDPFSMQAIVDQMDTARRSTTDPGRIGPRRGEFVEGVVTSVGRDGILIDIGTKAEAEVANAELASLLGGQAAPEVGSTILAQILTGENAEGRAVVSILRAREEQAWRRALADAKANRIVEVRVTEANRGGLVVDFDGLRGFIPLSQIASVRISGLAGDELQEKLGEAIDRTISAIPVEVRQRHGRLVLSERAAAMNLRAVRRAEMMAKITPGSTLTGRVTSITDYGAFVDLGGVDGLVHLSELAWRRVQRATEVVAPGDEVSVYVLGVDTEQQRISLSIRRTLPEPWQDFALRHSPGDIVEGVIARVTQFGAFATLDDGVEGLIHISEMSDRMISNPRDAVTIGERRRMRILRIDVGQRRLGLSLRGIIGDADAQSTALYTDGEPTADSRMGDLLRHWLDDEESGKR